MKHTVLDGSEVNIDTYDNLGIYKLVSGGYRIIHTYSNLIHIEAVKKKADAIKYCNMFNKLCKEELIDTRGEHYSRLNNKAYPDSYKDSSDVGFRFKPRYYEIHTQVKEELRL